ncbi:hypothetical protein [Halobacteriovorax sp. BALOs_7]|uniref:hypothetical protein n=1 Tax=Halobacteriovorax sp. BALOs_7 TaxID=2109558 RepID=UPI0013C53918|nr:hypothetical protein [Halobacteriovorax sp. BALOs_7]
MRKTLTLFTLLSLTTALANDNGEAQYLQVISSKNPLFKSAMQVEGVREMYSECYQIDAQNGKLEDGDNKLSNCLWDRIKADEGIKEKVMKLVNEQSGEEGTGRYRTTMETTKKQSAGLKGLKEFFQKRLEEALYGEYQSDKGRFEKIADQRTFFELYKTQLGKNIIASMTSYCIETGPYATEIDETKIPAYPLIHFSDEKASGDKNKNIASLNKQDIEKGAYSNWERCIQNLPVICAIGSSANKDEVTYKKYDVSTKKEIEKSSKKYSDILGSCEDRMKKGKDPTADETETCEKIVDNSNMRACQVVQYIELAKQSLLKTDDIVAKLDKKSGMAGIQNVEFYDSTKNQDESINALTTISSGEALEALSEGHKQDVAKMEECYKDGAIVDAEACSQYLATDKEEQYALLGELKVQQEATLEKLKNSENDPEEIAKILIEEGYTETQAQELATIQGVKEQVESRYQAKKDAILASLREEIEAHTTTGDEFDANNAQDVEKIAKIAKDIESRPENFSKLVHYNNIISSFLEVSSTGEDGEEVKNRNTASLSAEMKNSFLSEENKQKYEEMNVNLATLGYSEDQLGERFAQAGIDYSEAPNDDTTVELEDINKLIFSLFDGAENIQEK